MKSHRQLRTDAEVICSAALRSVSPEVSIRRVLRRRGAALCIADLSFDLSKCRHVWALGAGKAAAPMGQAVERIIGKYLSGGFLVTKDGHGLPLERLELVEAGHPLPDARGLAAGASLTAFAEKHIGRNDLVLCLLSGGGSALLVSPASGVSLEDKLACTRLLLNAGASIHEFNTIRKHLSCLKGGGLARLLAPARVVSLILSDVVGDPLDTIASGPLVADTSTFGDGLEIFRKYGLEDRIPIAVRKRFEEGSEGRIPETPKPGDPIFRRCHNLIVANNVEACSAAALRARRLGYHTMVLTTRLEGDTAEAAAFHLSIIEEIVAQKRPLRRPACIVSGGETTVRVTGGGAGGRNQEFALVCARRLARLPAPCVVASLGTDGTDGPTDAAGALVDNSTVARSLKYGSNFLEASLRNNDSYSFFKRLGDLIVTGPTRTNVMDVHLVLIG